MSLLRRAGRFGDVIRFLSAGGEASRPLFGHQLFGRSASAAREFILGLPSQTLPGTGEPGAHRAYGDVESHGGVGVAQPGPDA